ncbi:hypothetical protein J3A78_003240 [Streptomyces sp. PvR006]|nr:hypothetical protein [Streptomyces sp. PvR006]
MDVHATLQDDPDRQHQLRGRLATRALGGRIHPQWEEEVTAGGRGRYLVDEPRRTVRLVYAAPRHPKDTDWPRGRIRRFLRGPEAWSWCPLVCSVHDG